ncbi:DNA repair protein RecO [Candidatus Contubernalis alkaliaceticus]|uniref:DNA repair protein RecO n=1 Tax=Candidatus Contubernalis alkaliaceticus TaxID=338645 RepID=UPI001F4BF238|nr:DNA repair protein RecO [Candidatus Contubernalis alkalaceticus]UNC92995.1 DNA repair protein RecO [Candidatus Contubernalis alkalaceticus]
MKHLKTEALVIRSQSYSEADKLLTLLTLEGGKIPSIARGACKTKSKLSASVELFTRGDFLLYRGRTLATVTQGEILNSFYSLRMDLLSYAYGQYFCELIGRLLEENEPCPKEYRLFLSALEAMNGDTAYLEVLARSFELKLVKNLGYTPYLDSCLVCSTQKTPFRLSFREGGLLCSKCSMRDPGANKITPGTLSLLAKLLTADFKRLRILKMNSKQRQEIFSINQALLSYNFNLGRCKALAFLEQLGCSR